MTSPEDTVRGTAERIGLASESLPGTETAQLLEALMAEVGAPLTEEKLSQISVASLLRRLADGGPALDRDWIRQAVCYLRGIPASRAEMPRPPLEEGPSPDPALRVAFASDSGASLDGHFGSCLDFLIYDVSADNARLLDVRPTDEAAARKDPSGYRVGLVADCHLVYLNSIGGPAAAKVVRAGIYPLKVENRPIREEVTDLQEALRCPRIPWMARLLDLPTTVDSEAQLRAETEEAG